MPGVPVGTMQVTLPVLGVLQKLPYLQTVQQVRGYRLNSINKEIGIVLYAYCPFVAMMHEYTCVGGVSTL